MVGPPRGRAEGVSVLQLPALALAAALAIAPSAALPPSPVSPAALAPRLARVPARAGAAQAALDAAAPGDTVVLARGVHPGPLVMRVRVVLRGEPGAVLDGGGHGTILLVGAPGATLEDIAVRGSGARTLTVDAGIHVKNAPDVTLRRVTVDDVLYAVYAERSDRLVVVDSRLRGRTPPLREDGEGNGIHLWNTSDARLARNDVTRFVDAVYLSFADRVRVEDNVLHHDGRYGLHTMYCQGTHLLRNRFEHNTAGCAIMFSNHLLVERNDFLHNRGPRTYGLLLRDCSEGVFEHNRLVDNTIAVFMDNSNRNRLRANLVQDNGWGLLIFSSCARNVIAGNAFLNDDYPVALDMRRSDNRFDDGATGNHWSDNAAYDLDGDGISDVPFSPVGAFAFLSKQYPDLTVLAKSPAVMALGVAERVVPALRPSEVVDHFPLVTPPVVAHDRGPGSAGAPRRAWPAAAGFGALATAGALGLARARGRA
jgi:nitrous oxidase accessory protein